LSQYTGYTNYNFGTYFMMNYDAVNSANGMVIHSFGNKTQSYNYFGMPTDTNEWFNPTDNERSAVIQFMDYNATGTDLESYITHIDSRRINTQNIKCKTLNINGYDIMSKINMLENRLSAVENGSGVKFITLTTEVNPSGAGYITESGYLSDYGEGVYEFGSTSVLKAIPYDSSKYKFVDWTVINMDNPEESPDPDEIGILSSNPITTPGLTYNIKMIANFEAVNSKIYVVREGIVKTVDVDASEWNGFDYSMPITEFTLAEFTPSVSGTYQFEVVDATHNDTYGVLYNSTKSELLVDGKEGDEAGDGSHFLFTYDCSANTQYYIGVKFYQRTAESGTADLLVTRISSDGSGDSGGGNETPYYTVNTAVSPSGAGAVTGAGQYKYGTSIYPVATPSSSRYKIKGWLIKDDDTGEVDRSFENFQILDGIQVNVYSNTTITALFEDTQSGGDSADKITFKVTTSGATSSDFVGWYKIPSGSSQPDLNTSYGTTVTMSNESDSYSCYASAGTGRIISQIDLLLDNEKMQTINADELIADNYLTPEKDVLKYGFWFASELLGHIVEVKVYFADDSSGGSSGTKNITILSPFSDRGSVEVQRNGINVTNNEGVYQFNIGDTVIVEANGVSGYTFARWADGDYNDLWDDNPHTFIVTSSSPTHIMGMFTKA
jgi:hypothetical protein